MRIGHGYDVHRYKGGRNLILAGVDIQYPLGLDGHSDADVVAHAVMDSLLGAAALGDIGLHFPDTDSNYKNADSMQLLKKVDELIREKGYTIQNIDVTILAQQPKLRPFIAQMCESLVGCLGLHTQQVNVKATTEEGLGFTGSMEGMACHCVCLLK